MGLSNTLRSLAARTADAVVRRSAFTGQNRPAVVYPSSSALSTIPHYREPSPRDMIVEQRRNRNIVRSMARINGPVKSVIDKKIEIYVGEGPVPESPYKDLTKLFLASAPYLDNRDAYDFGGWVAEEVCRNFFVDGDMCVRVRDRRDRPRWSDLQVPIQFQALTCDWMPDDYCAPWRGNVQFLNGVAIDNDQVQAYAVYNEHPGDAAKLGRTAQLFPVPRNEIYHLYRSSTGNPRGEVPLAAVITMAEDVDDLDQTEMQRKKNATAMANFFEQPTEGLETGGLPGTPTETDDRYKAMRNLRLKPGDSVLLPPGLKVNSVAPAGEGANYASSRKTQLMQICAIAGVPYYEAMGDTDAVPERSMRYVGAGLLRRARIERAHVERHVLRRLWIDFVSMAIVTGMWTPPNGASLVDIFRVTWKWPVIQSAQLDRELTVMSGMVKVGLMPPRKMVEDYFGISYDEMLRQFAEDAARQTVLGIKVQSAEWSADTTIAKLILKAAEEQELHEQQMRDEARTDASIVPNSID